MRSESEIRMEGITQTEQIIMLLGAGLLMVGAGNLLNLRFRKRHCAQCGAKVGTKGKRYSPEKIGDIKARGERKVK